MGRTKQTARKSTGGQAPRKQLATKAERCSFQNYFQSQQSVGVGAVGAVASRTKSNFMNTEVAFDCFQLAIPGPSPSSPLQPRISSSCVDGHHFLGLSFASTLDGLGMAHAREHVPLQLSIVLDISGSMGSPLPEDPEAVSKLQAAKTSILAILEQLKPSDQLAITLFNHQQQLLVPLQSMAQLDLSLTKRLVSQLSAKGGTRLAEGFEAGAKLISAASNSVKRVIFLTDMQSSADDEAQVLRMIREEARTHSSFSTVLGIGVDLSMAAVQQVSSTPGGRYISVAIAEEFQRRLSQEFAHDSIPIAFDIRVELLDGAVIEQTAGHPELAGLAAGCSEFVLSSEFATASPDNTGMILLRVGSLQDSTGLGCKLSWRSLDGKLESVTLSTPTLADGTHGCDGIRKAVAVWDWVQLLDDYVMDESSAVERAASATSWIHKFSEFRPWFMSELAHCDDLSLHAGNASFLQTLDQMLSTEEAELLRAEAQAAPVTPEGCPADFMCPITQSVMNEPVIAADGHSYERSAISEWLTRSKSPRSPKTNLSLPNVQLIPNHTLRAAIQSFLGTQSSEPSKPKLSVHRNRSKQAPMAKHAKQEVCRRSERVATNKGELKYSK